MLLQPRKPTASSTKHAPRTLYQSLYGLSLLLINLLLDGVTNATQDRIFHTYRGDSNGKGKMTGLHMMLGMNVGMMILMTV